MTFVQVPTGSMLDYAGTTAPMGFLLCAGQAISRTTYAGLFAKIGTNYGAGDGSTTFNVPDYRGRVHAVLDNLGGTDAGRLAAANTLGGSGGAETHALSTAELAVHSHANTASQASHAHGGATGADGAHTHGPGVAGRSFVTATTSTLTNRTANTTTPANVTRWVAGSSGGSTVQQLDLGSEISLVVDTDGATDSQKNNAATDDPGTHTHTIASATPAITMTNANAGSGTAHNNLQPYILGGKIIKT